MTGELSRERVILDPCPRTRHSPSPAPPTVAVRRPVRRRTPRTLEQIPVWTDAPTGDGPSAGEGDRGLEALLGGLNPEQLRAVTHGDGPLLVVAGAGTGKTQVVTRRIAWLIATRRARPSEILALTFTDKAAAEMQARVDGLVPYGYTDTAISTFHAFGDRLIREYAFELGLAPDVRVLSRPEVVIFLRERLFDFELERFRPLGDPTRFLGALATHFSRLKDEDIDPATYLAAADREATEAALIADLAAEAGPTDVTREAALAAVESAERQLELARAYARFQVLLGEAGFIDFGDQVALALRLVRQSAAARTEIRQRFRYILVDEFQDTNRAQAELVELIAGPDRNVTVVGDDDQSIYRFRGAAMSNIVEFRERDPRAGLVVLRRNYRSRTGILAASHRLIRFNDPDRLEVRAGIDKRLRAMRPDRPPDGVGRGPPMPSRPARRRPTGSPPRSRRRIAAGAAPRDHADPRPVERRGRSDPAQPEPGRHPLAVLRHFGPVRPARSQAAARVPAGRRGPRIERRRVRARRVGDVRPWRRRPDDDRGECAPPESVRVWDVLEEVDRQPGLLRLAASTRSAVRRLVADLRRFSTLAHGRPAGEVLYAFLRETGWLARLPAPTTPRPKRRSRTSPASSTSFAPSRRSSPTIGAPSSRAISRTLIEAGDDPPTADLDSDSDAVAVLTVHRAKGLEFPTVFMVGPRRRPVPVRRPA